MSSKRDQEKWLEELLRRRSAVSHDVQDACLDADTLAAWVGGALGAKELEAVELHLSGCARCTAVLAAIERTTPVAADASPRAAWLRWLVPIGAAATAVALWVAIPEQQVTPVASEAVLPSAASAPPALPVAPAPPAAPAPAQAQAEAPKRESAPPTSADTRADALYDRARRQAPEERKERALEADAAAEAPAAGASAVAQREMSLKRNQMAVVESVAPDPTIRWRVLAGTDIERSIDGGRTWTRRPSPTTAGVSAIVISAIRAVDALNASVTTSDGRTLSTSDGGVTWAPVQEKPTAPF